ncbi:ABC-2 type transport system ATP-binding protein [Thiohalomonas denitrificans]|uniref:ABC-2 type transport system ATP-binding protein n=1 Tax=Thiohalomonas denitrificans TaxID=415747 RepID=A0A1G5Q0X8_9GAMM|nr:ABC-2 type transport system ATP-binding protein [Thiohalomonas denitrificans]
MASAAAIHAEGLGRRFGRQSAIENIDLTIARGEVLGIVGPDGAGKTTLMQLFAAILDPSAGRCTVLGRDSVREAAAINAEVGYLSQGFTLYDRLTVEENLTFAARIRDVSPAAYRDRRGALLAMADLEPFTGRRAGQLSGGMAKKLSLCTSLIHEPPLLLLDELSLGVDPISRRELWKLLYRFRESGTTVVLTTAYMDEALQCDRIALLQEGRARQSGTPGSLLGELQGRVFKLATGRPGDALALLASAPEVQRTHPTASAIRILTHPGRSLGAETVASLEAMGKVTPAVPTLEDVFVAGRGEAPAPRPPFDLPAPSGISRPAVETVGVTVRFGAFTAVDGVSLRVEPGEVVGLLGPNGAGKTTLMRVLCALQPVSAGQARVAGLDVTEAPYALRQRIGYVSQRFSLYPELTTAENLAFFASAYGLFGRARREAVAWAAGQTGLTGREGALTASLSGAQRQRLALACAILHRPPLLFLDEPTSGVDPLARQRFWSLILALARSGMAVLVSTHYLEEANYCHKLALMHQGALVAYGSIPDLRAALAMPADAPVEALFVAYIQRVGKGAA